MNLRSFVGNPYSDEKESSHALDKLIDNSYITGGVEQEDDTPTPTQSEQYISTGEKNGHNTPRMQHLILGMGNSETPKNEFQSSAKFGPGVLTGTVNTNTPSEKQSLKMPKQEFVVDEDEQEYIGEEETEQYEE